jgi:hypothetical protein
VCLGELTPEELLSIRQQAVLSDRIFDLMTSSIEIMDEVDIILHPLKSELNWPLGDKGMLYQPIIVSSAFNSSSLCADPLDFTRSKGGVG